MTEEEIIKDLEQVIELHEEQCLITTDEDFESIQGLLDLYQKEKEKNKELAEMLAHRIQYTNQLEQDLFENCSNHVISKDKIKDKIKELENGTYDAKIILQQLLEE